MSVPAAIGTTSGAAAFAREQSERGHRTRLILAWLLAASVVLAIAGYGYDYYTLGTAQRPFSPKHELLRPSGTIGIKLGMLGVLLFFLIYLYPLRKKWGWLARQGNSRHWLHFHVPHGDPRQVTRAVPFYGVMGNNSSLLPRRLTSYSRSASSVRYSSLP
jgi:hypothetical protein